MTRIMSPEEANLFLGGVTKAYYFVGSSATPSAQPILTMKRRRSAVLSRVRDGSESARFRSIARRDRRWRNRRFIAIATS